MSNSNLYLIVVIIITGLISLVCVNSSIAGGMTSCGPPPNCPECSSSLDCENAVGCIVGEEECLNPSPSPSPTPGPNTTFHQVGGVAQGSTNTMMCCPFFSDVCAPCGNPALGFSYQTPSSCDGAINYKNLWVRCQDPSCNKLTKGSYTIQLCHYDQPDPSISGSEYCGEECLIKPGSSFNHCNANEGTEEVPEGNMIYVKIVPSVRPAPNAPLKGLWTALVEGCENQGHIDPYCGDGIINGDEECDGNSVGCPSNSYTCADSQSQFPCTCQD